MAYTIYTPYKFNTTGVFFDVYIHSIRCGYAYVQNTCILLHFSKCFFYWVCLTVYTSGKVIQYMIKLFYIPDFVTIKGVNINLHIIYVYGLHKV